MTTNIRDQLLQHLDSFRARVASGEIVGLVLIGLGADGSDNVFVLGGECGAEDFSEAVQQLISELDNEVN